MKVQEYIKKYPVELMLVTFLLEMPQVARTIFNFPSKPHNQI